MGTAVNSLVTLVRVTVPEASAIEWTDARIITYLNREYQEWMAELGKLPGPGHATMVSDVVLAANTTTVNLATLLNAATVGSFAAVKSAYYRPESGRAQRIDSAQPGQEESYVLGVGETAAGQVKPRARWLTRPAGVPTLNFGEVSSVDRNLRLYIRYKPPTLAAGDTTQSDPLHDDVLVLGTALRMLLEVSETDPAIENRYRELRQKFLEDERMAAGEHESETTKCTESGSEAMFASD